MTKLTRQPFSLVFFDQAAEAKAEASASPKLYLTAGLIGALAAGTFLNPITALLVLGYGLYSAWQANEEVSDQLEAIDDGLIAHLLDQKELNQYANLVGQEQVLAELAGAKEQGLELSQAAKKYLTQGKKRQTAVGKAQATLAKLAIANTGLVLHGQKAEESSDEPGNNDGETPKNNTRPYNPTPQSAHLPGIAVPGYRTAKPIHQKSPHPIPPPAPLPLLESPEPDKDHSARLARHSYPTNPVVQPDKPDSQPSLPNPIVDPLAQFPKWDADEDPEEDTAALDMIRNQIEHPCFLVFGAQGGGKSTMAKWLISERLARGHKVEIIDPHTAYGKWESLKVYGGGMNYEECNRRLVAFSDLVRRRYQRLEKEPKFNPQPITVLAEEFTRWSEFCPAAPAFFTSSLTDIRKIKIHVIFVNHGRTLGSLGAKAGSAQQRDDGMFEIEMISKSDETGKQVASGRAKIYWPGAKGRPVSVTIPDLRDQYNLTPPPQLDLALTPANEAPIASLKTEQAKPQNKAKDGPDYQEVVSLVREILLQAEKPMKASQIKQQRRPLKDRMTLDQLDEILKEMVDERLISIVPTSSLATKYWVEPNLSIIPS